MDAESFLILVYSTGHSEWNLALLIITAMQQGGYPYLWGKMRAWDTKLLACTMTE